MKANELTREECILATILLFKEGEYKQNYSRKNGFFHINVMRIESEHHDIKPFTLWNPLENTTQAIELIKDAGIGVEWVEDKFQATSKNGAIESDPTFESAVVKCFISAKAKLTERDISLIFTKNIH